MSLLFFFLFACVTPVLHDTAAATPEPRLAPAPPGASWTCDDGTWTWSGVVLDDDCAQDEGVAWTTEHARVDCRTGKSFSWRVGPLTLPCEAFGREFVCALDRTEPDGEVEGAADVHRWEIDGEFVGDTAARGTLTHHIAFVGRGTDDACATVTTFAATAHVPGGARDRERR